MVGGGLLYLVMHTTLSILLPVTVNKPPAPEESIEIDVGGTREMNHDISISLLEMITNLVL